MLVPALTRQVLALFTENFDYQEMRRDFLPGVLTSDILGVRVATHVIADEYASRVRSPHLYDAISRDLVERWVFPVVPEADLLEEHSLVYRRGNRYLGTDVVLSRSAVIGCNVVLGAGVSVGENSLIRGSVIGANCHIGADVLIEDAYVWANGRIENGCRVYASLIADGVHLRPHTTVNRGCLITSNVTLGPRAEVPSGTRIAKLGEHVDVAMRQLGLGDSDDLSALAEKHEFLGEGADGVVWEGSVDTLSDADDTGSPDVRLERRAAFEMGGDFHHTRPSFSDVESEDGEGEGDAEGKTGTGRHSGTDTESETEAEMMEAGTDDGFGGDGKDAVYGRNSAKFLRDAYDLVKHAIETDYVLDHAILEINGLKFACNATFAECRLVVAKALFHFVDPELTAKSVDRLFLAWAPLLAKFTQGVEEQISLVSTIQSICQESAGLERSFQFVVPILYKTDVIEEDAIIRWFELHEKSNSLYVRQARVPPSSPSPLTHVDSRLCPVAAAGWGRGRHQWQRQWQRGGCGMSDWTCAIKLFFLFAADCI